MEQQDRDLMIRLDENMRHVKESVDEIKRGSAAQWKKIDEGSREIEGLKANIDNLNEKVNDHVSGHWKWTGFIMGTPTALWAVYQALKSILVGRGE